jgi:hypothetical protein
MECCFLGCSNVLGIDVDCVQSDFGVCCRTCYNELNRLSMDSDDMTISTPPRIVRGSTNDEIEILDSSEDGASESAEEEDSSEEEEENDEEEDNSSYEDDDESEDDEDDDEDQEEMEDQDEEEDDEDSHEISESGNEFFTSNLPY